MINNYISQVHCYLHVDSSIYCCLSASYLYWTAYGFVAARTKILVRCMAHYRLEITGKLIQNFENLLSAYQRTNMPVLIQIYCYPYLIEVLNETTSLLHS